LPGYYICFQGGFNKIQQTGPLHEDFLIACLAETDDSFYEISMEPPILILNQPICILKLA
jgi:hypothetical protein